MTDQVYLILCTECSEKRMTGIVLAEPLMPAACAVFRTVIRACSRQLCVQLASPVPCARRRVHIRRTAIESPGLQIPHRIAAQCTPVRKDGIDEALLAPAAETVHKNAGVRIVPILRLDLRFGNVERREQKHHNRHQERRNLCHTTASVSGLMV